MVIILISIIFFFLIDQYIAHFKSLILLAPTGPLRMTNLPPLPFVHSEFSIRNDPELSPYLQQVIIFYYYYYNYYYLLLLFN